MHNYYFLFQVFLFWLIFQVLLCWRKHPTVGESTAAFDNK
jgi:hypothetical protein